MYLWSFFYGALLIWIAKYAVVGGQAASWNVMISSGERYWNVSNPMTWQDAWIHCFMNRAVMLVVDSSEIYDTIQDLDPPVLTDEVWLGLTDAVTSGVFRWVNGRVLQYERWAQGMPNHNEENQHCASMKENGEWENKNCLDKLPFICRAMTQADFDSFYCKYEDFDCAPWISKGFDKKNYTKSCDNMEATYVTDGAADDAALDDNPFLCQDMCQKAVHFICRTFEESSHCKGSPLNSTELQSKNCFYEHNTDIYSRSFNIDVEGEKFQSVYKDDTMNQTWQLAWRMCRTLGKQLLTVKSSLKDQYLYTLDRNISWLGLHDSQTEGAFRWLDGMYPLYHNWTTNYPNGDKDKNCVYRNTTGKWIDADCNLKLPYLCEDISHCASRPCQNGASCEDFPKAYKCHCAFSFKGLHCSEFDGCASAPCENGATCIDANDTVINVNNTDTEVTDTNVNNTDTEVTDTNVNNTDTDDYDYDYDTAEEYTCICAKRFKGVNCSEDIPIQVFVLTNTSVRLYVDHNFNVTNQTKTTISMKAEIMDYLQSTNMENNTYAANIVFLSGSIMVDLNILVFEDVSLLNWTVIVNIVSEHLLSEKHGKSKNYGILLTWASMHINLERLEDKKSGSITDEAKKNVSLHLRDKLQKYLDTHIEGFSLAHVAMLGEKVVINIHLAPLENFQPPAWARIQTGLHEELDVAFMDGVLAELDSEFMLALVHSSADSIELEQTFISTAYQVLSRSQVLFLALIAFIIAALLMAMMAWKAKRIKERGEEKSNATLGFPGSESAATRLRKESTDGNEEAEETRRLRAVNNEAPPLYVTPPSVTPTPP